MTKCPLTRGVRLREVSVSGDSTVKYWGNLTTHFSNDLLSNQRLFLIDLKYITMYDNNSFQIEA